MNSDEQHHENELLDALLQEHHRTDREQEIQAIEAALTARPTFAIKKKSKPQWPWAVGIAASVTLTATYFYNERNQQDLLAVHYSERPTISYSQVREEVKKETSSSILAKPKAPSFSAPPSALTQIIDSNVSVPANPTITASEETYDLANNLKGDSIGRQQESGDKAGSYFSDDSLSKKRIVPPMSTGRIPADPTHPGDRFGALIDPAWKNPLEDALSTFSVDVDNASYSNIRRMILEGRSIPHDAVRIEECINAFDYTYAAPTNDDAFAVHQNIAVCPWNEKNALLRIGIKGREIAQEQRPASNLVFLIDVSGSMQSPDKLPLVKESLKLLLGQLDERDSVSYVVYAGSEGVALPPTNLDEKGRVKALEALTKLESGGSTNGGAGIKRAYDLAAQQFRKGGVNRVILCSDGDFNVGVTNTTQLVSIVKERAAANIYLSVLSFGTGNLNEEMLEAIARDGNGNHYYIDSIKEAHRVFLQKLTGTLITIAKDVKLQLEFNPARVKSYRLIGYANRVLRNEDFANDRVDAGDIGAGHEVTAFYEIVHADGTNTAQDTVLKYQTSEKKEAPSIPSTDKHADEWLTLKLRHKHPEGDKSALQEHVLRSDIKSLQDSDADFRFAASVAMAGMKLRNDTNVENVSWKQIQTLASDSLGKEPDEVRTEFLDLLRKISE
ncbi:MAG: VWA domain-containing protein [Verrucomicrobiota bacterium]